MRADIRDRLRQIRSQSDDAANDDERQQPVHFNGPVGTVILRQEITADRVHIGTDAPAEEEPS